MRGMDLRFVFSASQWLDIFALVRASANVDEAEHVTWNCNWNREA